MSSHGRLSCRAAGDGGILIVVLWTVFFLGTLAVAVGSYVGARVETARRMSDRFQARQAVWSGVQKCIAVVEADTNAWDGAVEPWVDNPDEFREIRCGEGVFSVSYPVTRPDGTSVTNYGLQDAQSRLDLNLLDTPRLGLLTSLLRTEGGLSEGEATELTGCIESARTPSHDALSPAADESGWVSSGIPHGPFMAVEELLWVRGMSDGVFEKIRSSVTVHGGSRVNINSAEVPVLMALFAQDAAAGREAAGDDELVRKILNFRQSGGIFKSSRNLAESLEARQALSPEERRRLAGASRYVTVTTDRFRGRVRGYCRGRQVTVQEVEFVWNRNLNRIEYWHED